MSEILGPARDALILQILRRLDDAKPHADADAWERGWKDALERFRANPCAESLVPAFIRPGQPTRFMGGFWDDAGELAYVRGVQKWLAETFAGCEAVYEYGCGTGFNLVALANLMPGVDFCGFDRSKHAVALVREAGVELNLPIGADRFDMLDPQPTQIPAQTGVLTFGAMEQLGNFRPFIEYLLAWRPRIVVHVEPIPELLDPENLIDWLSLRFHEKRGYTRGLLPFLEGHPRVEVLKVERSHFGSLMLESYARITWRPR